jgi:hypothetical protein
MSFISYEAPGGAPASVQISYTLASGALQRRVDGWHPGSPGSFSGGSWAKVAQSMASVQFTYYDADGLVVANDTGTEPPAGLCPPASGAGSTPGQLSVEQMRRVRRIGVVLRAEATASRVTSEFFVLGNDVQLRNR